MNFHNQIENENIVKSWNLSESTNAKILNNPTLTEYLITQKAKYPFPPNYTPNSIKIYLDGRIAWSFDDEVLIETQKFSSLSQAISLEWKFDDECACFQINSELVIDRTKLMVNQDLLFSSSNELTSFSSESSSIS